MKVQDQRTAPQGGDPLPTPRLSCILTGQNSKGCSVGSYSSVQSLSCVQLSVTARTAACQASLSITNSWSLLKLMSIELVIPSNHLILCRPLLFLPSIFPSIRVFSNAVVIRVLNPFTQAPSSWSKHLPKHRSPSPDLFQDFFEGSYFKSPYWICYNTVSVLLLPLGHEAWRIWAPWPWIECTPPALEDKVFSLIIHSL